MTCDVSPACADVPVGPIPCACACAHLAYPVRPKVVGDGVVVFQSYGAWSTRPMNETLSLIAPAGAPPTLAGIPAECSTLRKRPTESADTPACRRSSGSAVSSEFTSDD